MNHFYFVRIYGAANKRCTFPIYIFDDARSKDNLRRQPNKKKNKVLFIILKLEFST